MKNWLKLLIILIIVTVILPLAMVMLDNSKDRGNTPIKKGHKAINEVII